MYLHTVSADLSLLYETILRVDIIGAVTRSTFAVVNCPFKLLPRETVFSSVTEVSQGKFPVLNIPGYAKKITRSAHDIYRGKLQWCLDAQGSRANHSTLRLTGTRTS